MHPAPTLLLKFTDSDETRFYWLQEKTVDETIQQYNAQAIILKLDDADGDPLASQPTISVIEQV